PQIAQPALNHGAYGGVTPTGHSLPLFPALGGLSPCAACARAIAHRDIPKVIPLLLCIILGATGLWICFGVGGGWPLTFVECAIHLTTALLVFYVFRRFSTGTMLAALGFVGWSLNIGEALPLFHVGHPGIIEDRVIVMSKVVAAIGMILIALEDQVAINHTGEKRERHAREEMEAYKRLNLARRRVEDFDRQS